MRDLTEEELKLAPEWATHYHIFPDGDILFECENKCTLHSGGSGIMLDVMPCKGVCDKSKEINRKPFNISDHEFGDTVGFVELDGDELTLNCTGMNYIELYKDDAIAIANALGVTAQDLDDCPC